MATKKDTYLISVITADYIRVWKDYLEADPLSPEIHKMREKLDHYARMADELGFDVTQRWFYKGTPAQRRAYIDLYLKTRKPGEQ